MTARIYQLPTPSQGSLASFRRRMRATGGRPCSVVPMPRLDAHLARRVARYADVLVCEMARRRTQLAAIYLGAPERFAVVYGWAGVRRQMARRPRPVPPSLPAVYVSTDHAAGWVPVALLERASRPERINAP